MRIHAFETRSWMKVLAGVAVLLAYAAPGSAVFGVRRRTAVVAYSAGAATSAAAASSSAAAQQQATAAQEQAAAQTAAAQSAAASAQASAASAQQAAAASKAPAPAVKTPQQKLEELQSLYKQGLISESDYNTAKAKILAELSQ
jgi:hypothetical protein